MAVTLFHSGSPVYALMEFIIAVLIGVWLCVYVPRNKARRAWVDKAGVLIAQDGFITGNSATAQALVEREIGKTQ